jgi:predicted  nucleic acid-binding Zn-ribbon protein
MIAAGTGIASLVGMWYMLQADIQEAKELPNLESLYENEYPSRPEGHNWPRSYEQYKTQVGSLQEDMDDVFDTMDELKDIIKELQKDIKDLERRKRDK